MAVDALEYDEDENEGEGNPASAIEDILRSHNQWLGRFCRWHNPSMSWEIFVIEQEKTEANIESNGYLLLTCWPYLFFVELVRVIIIWGLEAKAFLFFGGQYSFLFSLLFCRQPDKLDELNLDAFAEELERQGFGNKQITLYDIRTELNEMYKDTR